MQATHSARNGLIISIFMFPGCPCMTSMVLCCLQVRTYSKVFWKRYKELGEDQGEKYIKQIERGEQRIQRQQDIMDAIAAKMDRYRNPWQVLALITGIPLFVCDRKDSAGPKPVVVSTV